MDKEAKKRGFWGKIADALTEETPGNSGPEVGESAIAEVAETSASVSGVGTVNVDMQRLLVEAVSAVGNDYAEFEKMMETLGMIPEYSMRARAALAALNSRGITIESLQIAIEERLSALKGKEDEFTTEMAARRAKIDGMSEDISHIDNEIQELGRRIAKLQEEKANTLGNIASENGKIAAVEADFRVTAGSVKESLAKIQENLRKMGA